MHREMKLIVFKDGDVGGSRTEYGCDYGTHFGPWTSGCVISLMASPLITLCLFLPYPPPQKNQYITGLGTFTGNSRACDGSHGALPCEGRGQTEGMST